MFGYYQYQDNSGYYQNYDDSDGEGEYVVDIEYFDGRPIYDDYYYMEMLNGEYFGTQNFDALNNSILNYISNLFLYY